VRFDRNETTGRLPFYVNAIQPDGSLLSLAKDVIIPETPTVLPPMVARSRAQATCRYERLAFDMNFADMRSEKWLHHSGLRPLFLSGI